MDRLQEFFDWLKYVTICLAIIVIMNKQDKSKEREELILKQQKEIITKIKQNKIK